MTIAQIPSFSFRGTGRDRDHARRTQAAALDIARASADWLVMWRGLVLCAGPGLAFYSSAHPLLTARADTDIFLGNHDGRAIFVADISTWEPEPSLSDRASVGACGPSHPHAEPEHFFADLRHIMAGLAPAEAEMAATARALSEWHKNAGFCPACGAKTESGGAGWHRRCGGCARLHFPRTDPVVIMAVTKDDHFLLGRSPGWPEAMYSTLAGFIEPGETMEAAVIREVAEETGIFCDEVRYIASQPWPFPASLMLGCEASARTSAITLDPQELEDALWLNRADLARLVAGEHPHLRPPRPGSIARFLMENWLATLG